MIVLSIVTVFFQCWIMRKLTAFSYSHYIYGTILPALCSTALTLLPFAILYKIIPHTTVGAILSFVIGVLWAILSVFLCGLTKEEKYKVIGLIKFGKYKRPNK